MPAESARALLPLALVWLVATADLSALSPSFAALLGVAIAVSQAGAVSGVALWVPRNVRTRALSWILPGTAFAWIIGMPIVGLVAIVLSLGLRGTSGPLSRDRTLMPFVEGESAG